MDIENAVNAIRKIVSGFCWPERFLSTFMKNAAQVFASPANIYTNVYVEHNSKHQFPLLI